MLSFENDYNVGAHPEILRRLTETNFKPEPGYGFDSFCESAKRKIRKLLNDELAQIYFLSGGTQTNSLAISAMLLPFEGVVCAETGHIASHEAGAIEYTGHKVLTIRQKDGKITADDLQDFLEKFNKDENHSHTVIPGLVYLSYPTEYGTIYSKEELKNIYETASQFSLKVYIDGARLGYGLCCDEADLTLEELAGYCDAFYIGGTKVGALLGEALVFPRNGAPKQLFTIIKQHGALLSKGRVLGIQFDTLFENNLYFDISRTAIERAEELRMILKEKGYQFFLETPTNQQFVILSDSKYESLSKKVALSFWEKPDPNHTVVRFAVSWATTKEDLMALREIL